MNQFLDFVGGVLYLIVSFFLIPFEIFIYACIGVSKAIRILAQWKPQFHLPIPSFKRPVLHFHWKHLLSLRH